MTSTLRTLGIIGFGLMGGSLARQLKDLGSDLTIRGWSRNPDELASGLKAGALDEAVGDVEDLLQCDLVVLATPLGPALDLLPRIRGSLEPHTLVSDVISLKVPVLRKVESLGLGSRYVGSHPMVGGEGSGFGAARPDLYRDAPVWLVASEASEEDRDRVESFWASLGARTQWIRAEDHDERMVWLSHLPQLTANALALALAEVGVRQTELGPGGRDMTRLSASSEEMWVDLIKEAGPTLAQALGALRSKLQEFESDVLDGDFQSVARKMSRTRSWSRGE